MLADLFMQVFLHQYSRNFINCFGIISIKNITLLNICEQRNFCANVIIVRFFRATDQDIRLNSDLPKFGCSMLGRFCFQFTRCPDVWNISQENKERICITHIETKLANSFQERKTFDITDSSANFRNDYFIINSNFMDQTFNLVRDMRNDLNGLAEKFSFPFFLQNTLIDLTGSGI